jgi:DNA processing protein
MFDKNFILHLTLIDGIGPAIIQRIIEIQRSGAQASDLYLFSQTDWMNVFGFSQATSEKLVDGLANKKIIDEELILIERNNIQWITITDEMYPQLLREIYLPPVVLYFQGSFFSDRFDCQKGASKMMAVVGARKADNYGERAIDTLIPDLVAARYTIVSGGAQGIDTMAHKAALKCGGKTIAVLGSGLLRPYPSSNKQLFKSIIDNGGSIISSFPLRMEPLQGNFPARNRIITGLSRGCLVVQAAKKSGALISAHYAMEQGREVFAVPGPVDSELSIGCNTLIQSGAKLVMNAADILEEFGDRVIINSVVNVMQKELFHEAVNEEHYSSQQKKIIAACKYPSSFDSIVDVTQLMSETVQSELFNLQLDGVVLQDFTGMWITSKI